MWCRRNQHQSVELQVSAAQCRIRLINGIDTNDVTPLVHGEAAGNSLYRRWCAVAIALVFVYCIASLSCRRSYGLTFFGDSVQSALIALAAIATAFNAARTRDALRTFWMLMSAGCTLWLSAQLLWMVYEVGLRREVPSLFVGDIVLFLHVVPFMAALAMQPHIQRDRRDAALSAIDLALLLMWWLYLYLLLVIPWQSVQADLVIYGNNFDVVYLIENLFFVVAVGFVAWRSRAQWRRFYLHLFGAAVVYTAGARFAGSAIDSGRYYTGSLYDVPLVVGSAWLGCAVLSAHSLQPEAVRTDSVRSRVPLWPGRLAMIAVLSIPAAAWWVLVHRAAPHAVYQFRLILTLVAFFLLTAIVFYKQHFMQRELIKLASQANESLENLLHVQAQLVHSEKLSALGQLVAGAAHEINNPLTAIIGYSDLISDPGAEPRNLAEKIGQQARRTKALVHDLLSFARESLAAKKSTDLNAIVTTAMRLQRAQLANNHIAAELDLAASTPLVIADPSQILQVVMHITSNAIDALQEVGGGALKLMTRVDGPRVVFESIDNGPGIRDPNKVFDPFYTTKPVGKGTGLGLSMAYGVIRKHNGEISCWNNPSGGATFRVILPVGMSPKGRDHERNSEQVCRTNP